MPTTCLQTFPNLSRLVLQFGFSLPLFGFQRQGVGSLPSQILSSWHFNTYTPSLHHLIPPASKTKGRSRSDRAADPTPFTHSHVPALIPHGPVKVSLRGWDHQQCTPSSPFLTRDIPCARVSVRVPVLSGCSRVVCASYPSHPSPVTGASCPASSVPR